MSKEKSKRTGPEADKHIERMSRYVLEEEKELLGLTEEKLKEFLDKIFAKKFQGFERYKEPTIRVSKASGQLFLTQLYKLPDGRERSISVTVAKTDKGIKAPGLFTEIFFSSLDYNWPKEKPRNRQTTMKVLANAIKEILQDIQKTGLPGIVRISPSGELRLRKWNELIESYERHAAEEN